MSSDTQSGGMTAEVLAVAAAVVFIAGGIYLLRAPEMVVLRLAVLGWPTWPTYVLGVVQIVGALALLSARRRRPALVLLALVSVGELVAALVYRELQPTVQALMQLVLLAAILVLGRRRSRGK
ncbi:MAG: DoxX family protein [Gammaproteobacteria bacterium]